MRNWLKRSRFLVHLYRIGTEVLWEDLNRGQRWRYLTKYLTWYGYFRPRGLSVDVTLQNDMRSRVYADSDSGVSNVFTRNVDFRAIAFIRSVLQPGDFVVDAGCNVGNRTLVLADLIGGALLLDANDECIRRAKENFALNHIVMDNYRFVAKAVGENVSTVRFQDKGGTSCTNHIVEAGGDDGVAVGMTTVDHETSDNPLTGCQFLKIDCEGYDLQVLNGARRLLGGGGVRLVEFERWPTVPLDLFRAFFAEIGWGVFALDRLGNPTVLEATMDRASNLFARPLVGVPPALPVGA